MQRKESIKSILCTLMHSGAEGSFPVCELGPLCKKQQVMTNETKYTSHAEVLC